MKMKLWLIYYTILWCAYCYILRPLFGDKLLKIIEHLDWSVRSRLT